MNRENMNENEGDDLFVKSESSHLNQSKFFNLPFSPCVKKYRVQNIQEKLFTKRPGNVFDWNYFEVFFRYMLQTSVAHGFLGI